MLKRMIVPGTFYSASFEPQGQLQTLGGESMTFQARVCLMKVQLI